MAFGQRAAEDGEILRKDEHQPAVDRARPGDDAVAGDLLVLHAEIDAIVLDVHVELLERAFVEQHGEPFARGELALGVLRVDAFLPAAHACGGALGLEPVDDVVHVIPFARPLKRIARLLVNGHRAGMVAVEVARDDLQIAAVRAEGEIEHVADQRHEAEHGIDAEIACHSRDLPFGQAEIARFPDEVGAHRAGDQVADDRDQADDGVEPDGAAERRG